MPDSSAAPPGRIRVSARRVLPAAAVGMVAGLLMVSGLVLLPHLRADVGPLPVLPPLSLGAATALSYGMLAEAVLSARRPPGPAAPNRRAGRYRSAFGEPGPAFETSGTGREPEPPPRRWGRGIAIGVLAVCVQYAVWAGIRLEEKRVVLLALVVAIAPKLLASLAALLVAALTPDPAAAQPAAGTTEAAPPP